MDVPGQPRLKAGRSVQMGALADAWALTDTVRSKAWAKLMRWLQGTAQFAVLNALDSEDLQSLQMIMERLRRTPHNSALCQSERV